MTTPTETTLPHATTTADGSVIVGTDPTPQPPARPAQQPEAQYFTAEDLQKAREQEKSKLYSQIESLSHGQKAMNEELERLRGERESREQAEAQRVAAEEAAARKAAEDEMDVRSLLATKEQEWQRRLDEMEQARQRDRVLLDREREFSQLSEYRSRRIAEMSDEIIPELQDLVTGSSPEEIEASLAGLADRSNKIIESATSAAQAARRDMRGTTVTSPSAGPLDMPSGQRQFSDAELAAMPMSEYVKHRASLLNQASQSRQRGLLG